MQFVTPANAGIKIYQDGEEFLHIPTAEIITYETNGLTLTIRTKGQEEIVTNLPWIIRGYTST